MNMIRLYVSYLLSALGSDDDVELVGAVDWCRKSSGVGVVRVSDVRHYTVKHDVRVL